MIVISTALALIAAVLLLPAFSDVISIARALRRHRPSGRSPSLPRMLFLVPAYNEERLIADCVRYLRTMRYPADRAAVVVIAHNCSDRTAARARAGGADCLERHDRAQPGKPRAIAWALAQTRHAAYDAVVIIDADTVVAPGLADALAAAGPLRDKVIQAYFDVANP